MIARLSLAVVLFASAAAAAPPVAPEQGHVTGVGGVFFKSRDPQALAQWYKDVLGMPVEDWGG